VFDSARPLVGLVSEARLRRRLAERAGDDPISKLLGAREYLKNDQPLHEAVIRMNKLGVRQMAVVDASDATQLVGMFSTSDVIRAHARAADTAHADAAGEILALSACARFVARRARLCEALAQTSATSTRRSAATQQEEVAGPNRAEDREGPEHEPRDK
jgi:signal-transduction protein with cAMP-binding, CBS, and nucleotidyltransferase domain